MRNIFSENANKQAECLAVNTNADCNVVPQDAEVFLSQINHLKNTDHVKPCAKLHSNSQVLFLTLAQKYFGIRLFKVNPDFIEQTQKNMNREVNTNMIKFYGN